MVGVSSDSQNVVIQDVTPASDNQDHQEQSGIAGLTKLPKP